MRDSDVVVVGAGPAGALTAMILARAGVSVRLLDRAQFPRDKLCGDTLNPGSLAILDRHGVAAAVRARSMPVPGMTVTGPGGVSVSADYGEAVCGAAIRRRDLDLLLLDAAMVAGARFEPCVSVTGPVLSDGARVVGVQTSRDGARTAHQARIVIAADGRSSRLGTALGLTRFARTPRRWAFGAYFEGVRGLSARGEMHIRHDGYIGVAPLFGEITNVCVVREHRLHRPRMNWRTVVREALASDQVLCDRFAHATQVSEVTVLGPLAMEANGSGLAGMLLAGDAAGFIDPMTGDGLRFALRGAELAAAAALSELSTGLPAFRQLETARSREFASKWRVNRALRSLVGSPRAIALAAQIGRRWPRPIEYLIRLAGDVPSIGH